MATTKSRNRVEQLALDVLVTPLRAVVVPIFDEYRKRDTKHMVQTVPAWAVSDLRNTPIPYTVEHMYDFGFGGVYGPPDMPVKAGVVNQERQIRTQFVSNGADRKWGDENEPLREVSGFNNNSTKNMEIFVYSPFALETDLPCATSALKY